MIPGATGNFPNGKLNKGDKGELKISIFADKGNIILDFGTPTAWIGLAPDDACNLAKVLLEHAAEIRKPQSVKFN